MARRKGKKEEEQKGNWLTTYGDMVTLILTFFILLYSFSNIDVMKFKKMLFSFRGAIGVIDGGKTFEEEESSFSGKAMEISGSARKQTMDVMKVSQRLRSIVKEKGLEDEIVISVNKRGVVVSISEGLLFGVGRYELLPEGKEILSVVGKILAEIPNDISAEGHTDSAPLRGSGPLGNNWDLSALRASRIIAFLESRSKISSKRLQSVGYGDSRPLMPNDNELHMQMNRRVDIVILS